MAGAEGSEGAHAALLSAVFHDLGEPALITRFPERVVLDVNPAFLREFGYARDELVGQRATMLHVDAAHQAGFVARLEEAWREDPVARFHWPLRRKDGSVFQAACTLSAVKDAKGERIGVVGAVRNLTREQAEHERLRLLVDNMSDVVSLTDTQGTILYVSPGVRAVTGHEPEELVGVAGHVHVHPDDFPLLVEKGRSAPEADFTVEYRARHKDGHWVWMESRTRVVRDEAGRILGRLANARDITLRKQAQEAAAQSEARWRSLVEDATDYIYMVDREGRILFMNRGAPGRPRDALVGTSVYDWFPPEARAEVRSHYARVFDEAKPITFTTALANHQGRMLDYETRVGPVVRDGVVVAATVVSRDVSERVALERRVRESEALVHHLSESGILGIAVADLDGRIVEANDAFLAAIGHPRASLDAGRLRWDAITPPEAAARDAQAVEELRLHGRARPYEKEYVRADGSRARVLVGVAMLPGEPGRCVAFALDVDPLRRAQEEVASEKRLAETILDAQAELGEGIAVVDPDGRLVHVNRALERITGYSTAEMLAMPNAVATVTAPEAAQTWKERFAALARGEPVAPRFDSWIRRKDGSSMPVEIVGTDLNYQAKRCRLYILRDLTAQRAARQELDATRAALAQAEKLAALGTLVSGVAHEARTPMTAMMNASHVLQAYVARGALDASVAPLLEVIVENAARLNGFIDELRRFTRMGHVARAPLRLQDPVAEGLRLFAQTHPAFAPLETRLEETPLVVANGARVVQVVLNLVENAVDATEGKGRVVVSTGRTPQGAAFLDVEDDGPGIDPAVRDRIFDPLVTTKPHGTGLGLAIVKRIADEHKARIEVDSAPGKGTHVRLVFPPA